MKSLCALTLNIKQFQPQNIKSFEVSSDVCQIDIHARRPLYMDCFHCSLFFLFIIPDFQKHKFAMPSYWQSWMYVHNHTVCFKKVLNTQQTNSMLCTILFCELFHEFDVNQLYTRKIPLLLVVYTVHILLHRQKGKTACCMILYSAQMRIEIWKFIKRN